MSSGMKKQSKYRTNEDTRKKIKEFVHRFRGSRSLFTVLLAHSGVSACVSPSPSVLCPIVSQLERVAKGLAGWCVFVLSSSSSTTLWFRISFIVRTALFAETVLF
ncbi:hypothetical protein NL676_011041 [Syzygium grande]|nr:hypothetical protein NL676_011041 [Syzygium grande]